LQPRVTPESNAHHAPGNLPGALVKLRLALGTMAGLALFAMMTLTFIDVVGRKLFNHSVIGSVEMTEMMMLALIFAGMPLASLAGEHVIFDLLDSVLPQRVKYWQAIVSNLICTGLLGVAAWFVFNRALRTQAMGDTTAQLLVPIAPFHFAAATLLVICALMHLYLALSGRSRG
jgi:TRAP-type C4-dicarboxylate transport system permease small subunit